MKLCTFQNGSAAAGGLPGDLPDYSFIQGGDQAAQVCHASSFDVAGTGGRRRSGKAMLEKLYDG